MGRDTCCAGVDLVCSAQRRNRYNHEGIALSISSVELDYFFYSSPQPSTPFSFRRTTLLIAKAAKLARNCRGQRIVVFQAEVFQGRETFTWWTTGRGGKQSRQRGRPRSALRPRRPCRRRNPAPPPAGSQAPPSPFGTPPPPPASGLNEDGTQQWSGICAKA